MVVFCIGNVFDSVCQIFSACLPEPLVFKFQNQLFSGQS